MKTKLLSRIEKLKSFYESGEIKRLSVHEVNPGFKKGERLNYLYFTLPVCINYQRNSPAMWQSALKTWEDPKTNYLFYPEKVVKAKFEKVQKDLFKHRLSLQINNHTKIWTRLCKTLHDSFNDDPKNVLSQNDYDVSKILNFMQKEHPELFPSLKGIKMANYWMYILSKFTDVKLKNTNLISIIPDTHIIQSSIKLGLVGTDATPESVSHAWRELLSDSKFVAVELHAVLWNWSRNNFTPEV